MSDWILVPREPTEAMLTAASRTWDPYAAGVAFTDADAASAYAAMIAAAPSPWQGVETAPEKVSRSSPVDLWLDIPASLMSMGFSDSFRVPDCWREDSHWVHVRNDNGKVDKLDPAYITHWMRQPTPPGCPQ